MCLKQVLQSGFFFKGPEISSALANAPDCGGILVICRVLEGSTPSNYIHVEILLKAWNYVSYDALNLLKSIAPGAPIPTINFFGVVVAADVIRPTSLQQMKEAITGWAASVVYMARSRELELAAHVTLGPHAANITHVAESGQPVLMLVDGPPPMMAQSAPSAMPRANPALLNQSAEELSAKKRRKPTAPAAAAVPVALGAAPPGQSPPLPSIPVPKRIRVNCPHCEAKTHPASSTCLLFRWHRLGGDRGVDTPWIQHGEKALDASRCAWVSMGPKVLSFASLELYAASVKPSSALEE